MDANVVSGDVSGNRLPVVLMDNGPRRGTGKFLADICRRAGLPAVRPGAMMRPGMIERGSDR